MHYITCLSVWACEADLYTLYACRRRTTNPSVERARHLNRCGQAKNLALFSQPHVQGISCLVSFSMEIQSSTSVTMAEVVVRNKTSKGFLSRDFCFIWRVSQALRNFLNAVLLLVNREFRWQPPLLPCELCASRRASSSWSCPTGSSASLSPVAAAVTLSCLANVK